MAPTPSPDASKYTIVGNVAKILPSGGDDWDNLQTVATALAGLPGAKLEFASGTFFFSYQVDFLDFDGEIFGPGAVCTAGLVNAPMTPLDAVDREVFNSPAGWPGLFHFRETMTALGVPNGTPVNLHVHDLKFEGTKAPGHQGIAFGGLTHRNICANYFISCANPMMYIQDESIVLNGTTPTALANTNVEDVSVNAAALMQGTKFVEGAGDDYTVDLVAGTIVRTIGSSIGDGATVYVGYSNGQNLAADAMRYTILVEDCEFEAALVKQDGITHPNVDGGIRVWGGQGWLARSSIFGVFNNVTYTNIPELASLLIDASFAGVQKPWNGELKVRRCEFKNGSSGVVTNSLDGVAATPGGVVYPAGSLERGLITIEDCEFKNVAMDNETFYPFHNFQSSTCDIILRRNACKTVATFARFFPGGQVRKGAWDGTGAMSIVVEDNEIRDLQLAPGEFGAFAFQPLSVWGSDTGGLRSGNVDGNKIELTGFHFRNPLMVEGLAGGAPFSVKGNVISAKGNGLGPAAIMVGGPSAGADLAINDLSKYKRFTPHDIQINANAVGTVVHAEPGDVIDDDGTDSIINGGTTI